MINNKIIDTKEIYIGFKIIFEFQKLCIKLVDNFQQTIITHKYMDSFVNNLLYILSNKTAINLKTVFLNHFYYLTHKKLGYENVIIQNRLLDRLLNEIFVPKNNLLIKKEKGRNL